MPPVVLHAEARRPIHTPGCQRIEAFVEMHTHLNPHRFY